MTNIGISGMTGPLHSGARQGITLKSGDLVSVRVLEKAGPGSWKVSIGGKLHTAVSEFPLEAGKSVPARIQWIGNTLHLKLGDRGAGNISSLLLRNGLPDDTLSRAVLRSFIRNGSAVDPGKFEQLKKLLQGTKGSVLKNARLLSLLDEKGIRFTPSPGKDLVNTFFFDQDGRESSSSGGSFAGDDGKQKDRQKRERKQQAEEGKDEDAFISALRGGVSSAETDGSSMVQLFNHLKGGAQHWIAIPFRFSADDEEWDGIIRLLIDDAVKETPVMSVSVSNGKSEWGFVLQNCEGKRTLKLIAENDADRRSAEKNLPILETALEHKGVFLDRSIQDGRNFDGFSDGEDEPSLGGVDLVL